MKESYEIPVLLITEFAAEDVITSSGIAGSDNELPGDDL